MRFITRMKGEQGGVMISFAILLPLLMILIAFGLNSLKMFISKAKISDVAAEVGLMVSAYSSVGSDKPISPEMQALMNNFVIEFFPESIKTPVVSVGSSRVITDSVSNISFTAYQPYIEVELPFPFYDRLLSHGDKNFTVTSPTMTVKKKVTRPVDLVFVMDFSTSQQGPGMRLLKRTFKDLTDYILESNPQSKIAMVPFTTGVSVKYPGTNQRGGVVPGCSVLFVPKKGWDINYAYWSDKALSGYGRTLDGITYWMDKYRYEYYSKFVRSSTPALSLSSVLDKWCSKNEDYGTSYGHEKYTCFDNRKQALDSSGKLFYPDDIFSEYSLNIIKSEYDKALKVRNRHERLNTIEHADAIDFPETLKKMFSDEAIITFPMLWSPLWDANFRAYDQMCLSSGSWKEPGELANNKLNSWLIELTDNAKELNEFQDMIPMGWTATTSGLVRSVPVMMKGRNPRKVFVIMSDGDDSPSPAIVTDIYLRDYKLCEKIKTGIMERPETNAERVDIYYVSTINSRKRVAYWSNNCTGEGNAANATNYDEVISLIKGYLSDEIGSLSY